MLRGINRQDIFEDQEDYVRFLTFMQQMLEPLDDLGNHQPSLCTFYAYCLMSNHVHLLIKTHHEDIGATVKHLAVVYAMYFNHKYSRAGHLFQDRFKSEPVNDMAYFTTLLRYIHQNPLKAASSRMLEITLGAAGGNTRVLYPLPYPFVPPTSF
jgi:REP element-mobilizing transposase RayT